MAILIATGSNENQVSTKNEETGVVDHMVVLVDVYRDNLEVALSASPPGGRER